MQQLSHVRPVDKPQIGTMIATQRPAYIPVHRQSYRREKIEIEAHPRRKLQRGVAQGIVDIELAPMVLMEHAIGFAAALPPKAKWVDHDIAADERLHEPFIGKGIELCTADEVESMALFQPQTATQISEQSLATIGPSGRQGTVFVEILVAPERISLPFVVANINRLSGG